MAEVDENKDSLNSDEPIESDDHIDSVPNQNGSQLPEFETKREKYHFSDLSDQPISKTKSNLDFILDIPLEITVELGRTKMLINELLKLGQGSVIELSKFAGEHLDVLANQRLIAKGEVVAINDKYGIRLTEIISPMERVMRLK